MLRRLAERTSVSDRPPVVTSGDASLAILSQDTLQSGYRAAGAEDQYRFSTGRLTGLTPFSYAAGTLPTIHDENVSANVVIGDLGAESALLAEASDRENTSLIAASDDLSAQSVFFASAQDPLIGEELFAAGAYVGAGASHEASLHVQDILRWLIILAIIIGSLLKIYRSAHLMRVVTAAFAIAAGLIVLLGYFFPEQLGSLRLLLLDWGSHHCRDGCAGGYFQSGCRANGKIPRRSKRRRLWHLCWSYR